jgi:hypothetical protein
MLLIGDPPLFASSFVGRVHLHCHDVSSLKNAHVQGTAERSLSLQVRACKLQLATSVQGCT